MSAHPAAGLAPLRFRWLALAVVAALATLVVAAADAGAGLGAVGQSTPQGPQGPVLGAMPAPSGPTSWLAQEPFFQPAAIDCPTRAVCYAAGTEGPEDSVTASDGIVATSIPGSATWQIQSLPVGTPSLSLLACPSARRCFAAPSGIEPTAVPAPSRFVASTDDGGATWRAEALPGFGSPQPFALTGLACPTSSQCVVVGHTGSTPIHPYLAVTTNGGMTWITPALPASVPPPAGVSCPTSTLCLVVGTSIAGGHGRESALRTLNGGLTWTIIQLPQEQSLISGVACASSTRCLVVGLATIGLPSALVTTDGGRKWSTEWLPAALSVPDSVVCAASACLVGSDTQEANPVLFRSVGARGRWRTVTPLASRHPPAAYECRGSTRCEAGNAVGLFSSSDRGKVWAGPSGSAFPGNADESPFAVACTTARSCSVSTVFVGSGEPPRYPLISSTSNGGRSWHGSSVANGGSAGGGAIACANPSDCWVLGTDFSPVEVFSTVDAGAMWSGHTFAAPSATPSSRSVGVDGPGNSISCPTTSDCAALGLDAVGITRTTDGGRTWIPATVVAPTGTFVDGIDCPVASTCWAVGGSGTILTPEPAAVLLSTDGGARWKSQPVPVGVEALTDISCATARRCVAVGVADFGSSEPSGVEIVSTDDGGATWLTRPVPSGIGSLVAISCPNASLCVAVGSATTPSFAVEASGTAIISTDGGVSWESEAVPSGAPPLNAISCSASGHCVAIGGDAILTTSNGGSELPATVAARSTSSPAP
jgi:photosystem II stability/assembly factor-like uncharacterized protein